MEQTLQQNLIRKIAALEALKSDPSKQGQLRSAIKELVQGFNNLELAKLVSAWWRSRASLSPSLGQHGRGRLHDAAARAHCG